MADIGKEAGLGFVELFQLSGLLLDEGVLTGQFPTCLPLLVQANQKAAGQQEYQGHDDQGGAQLRLFQAQFQLLVLLLSRQLFLFQLEVVILQVEPGANR